MKRFVLLYTLLLSLFSCSNNNRMSELSSIDNMLDSLDYASASKALVKIGTEKLSGEQKAYYQLLKTRYAFGKNNFIDDSLSLNACIDYYKAKNMKDELARAYFYKGEMYRLAGDMAKALFYEKESELIFKNCNLNKRRNLDIYQQLCEALAYINIIFDEDKLSLHYCKLSLQSAQKLGDKRYQVFTLGMASSCCSTLGMEDSVGYYRLLCIPLLPYTHNSCKGYAYSIIADYFINKDNRKAKEYLDSALYYSKDAVSYRVAGYYNNALGNDAKAEEMWKKSIDCDPNYLTQAETCKKIAALYYERGDLKNYALYMSKMSEAKDSLYARKKKYNMSELQSNINSSLSMKDLLDTITSASMGILIIILLCIVVFSLMLHRTRKRLIAVHNRLKAEKQSLEQAKTQIKSLKKESKEIGQDRETEQRHNGGIAKQRSERTMRQGTIPPYQEWRHNHNVDQARLRAVHGLLQDRVCGDNGGDRTLLRQYRSPKTAYHAAATPQLRLRCHRQGTRHKQRLCKKEHCTHHAAYEISVMRADR